MIELSQKSLPDGIYMDAHGELMFVEGRIFHARNSTEEVVYDMWELPLDKFILLTVMLNNAEYLGEI